MRSVCLPAGVTGRRSKVEFYFLPFVACFSPKKPEREAQHQSPNHLFISGFNHHHLCVLPAGLHEALLRFRVQTPNDCIYSPDWDTNRPLRWGVYWTPASFIFTASGRRRPSQSDCERRSVFMIRSEVEVHAWSQSDHPSDQLLVSVKLWSHGKWKQHKQLRCYSEDEILIIFQDFTVFMSTGICSFGTFSCDPNQRHAKSSVKLSPRDWTKNFSQEQRTAKSRQDCTHVLYSVFFSCILVSGDEEK